MKGIKAGVALLVLIGYIVILNRPLAISGQTIPPLGKFMDPKAGFWANARHAANETDISADLDLEEEVRVLYDERLVPHIFASTDRDLYYTQGYLHAKHRLWQMDLTVRSTSGRLSEVLGERTLSVDRESRNLGLAYAAENAVRGWSSNPELGKNLAAYIDGVNKFIDETAPSHYPLEFKLLDYHPEQWTLMHSALVMKAMAKTLAGRAGDVRATNTRAFLGKEKFDELFPERNPKASPIIPKGTSWDHIERTKIENEPKAPALQLGYEDFSPEDKYKILMGSNNWAVGPNKTADGSTILAGDPHLSLTLPSIWFETQLHAPGHNTYGVSIAGLHGIIIGFNEHIAWSETNVGHDIIDWFEIKWVDEAKTKYYFNGAEKEVTYKIEAYNVKGKSPEFDTIKYSVWGPIWEASENGASDVDLAMRWLAHDQQPASEGITFELLNRATNFDQYRKALSNYVSPAQNFVFASKTGDVAITLAGRLPVRGDEQGRFIQLGDDFKNDWPAMIPFEHNPYVLNPPRGFVSSANQVSTDDDYPYYYSSGGYFEQYRGRRLNDQLEEMENITVQDMQDLQYDAFSIKAEEALPIMLSSLTEQQRAKFPTLISTLDAWDYRYRSDTKAPVIFDIWFRALYFKIWDEFDETELAIDRPQVWKTIELMEAEVESAWFDVVSTKEVENLGDLIISTFDSAAIEIQSKMEDPSYNWNQHRNTKILHLGRIPAFSRNEVQTDGSRGTLNAVTTRTGPSWRMVVKFKDGVEAYGVYPGGQSGNPGSKHFDDMIDDWSEGKYYKLDFLQDPNTTSDRIISSILLK